MKKRFFKKFFIKYVFPIVAVIFVSFALISTVITVMVREVLTDSTETDIKRMASVGTNVLLLELGTDMENEEEFLKRIEEKSDSLSRALTAVTDKKDIFVFVCDKSGNPLISSLDGKSSAVKISAKTVRSVLDVGYSRVEKDKKLFENEHYLYASRIAVDGISRTLGIMVACAPCEVVDAPIREAVKIISLVLLWVTLAAVVVAYFVSDRIVRPLGNISRAAHAFSKGDFSVRVPAIGNDAIGELALVFNEMAASLENMDNMRSTFLANVSHDLRTPMTTIAGFIDGILDGAIPHEKEEYYLKIIREEVLRLSRLVSAILDISRIQAGERKFVMSSFDVCEMLRQTLISFEKRIDEKSLDVSFECDKERMYVLADMDAINQVLYNLCDNAVKFTRDGGRLAISVREKEKTAYVTVYNEGIGIPEQDIPYVFDRFYKADKSRGLDKKGVGLGLYICKTIVDAHGETISVDSKEGRYCEFTVTLKEDPSK